MMDMNHLLDDTGVYQDVRGYFRFDGIIDADTFRTAACRVGRNHAPALLVDLYWGDSVDLAQNPGFVADVWSSAEFPASYVDLEIWRDLFGDAGYTRDGVSEPLPTEYPKLYRGCHHERRFGMSWTASLGVAQWFANRDMGYGKGKVYEHAPKGHEVFALIDGGDVGRGEAEFVLDSAYLNDENVHECTEVTLVTTQADWILAQ